MAIQDSDPERRNLVVTSLAFIAYFYAGGSFQDNSIRVQVVNLNFSNTTFLGGMAWILLFWFLYRYWLTHKNKFVEGFKSEYPAYFHKKRSIAFVERNSGKTFIKPFETEGYCFNRFKIEDGVPTLKYSYTTDIQWDEKNEKITQRSVKNGAERGEVKLNNLRGYLLMLRNAIVCCIDSPSFSSYLVPYILFLMALAGPAFRYAL